MLRALLGAIVVALIGGSALWWGTQGGQIFTAETARRMDIAASPRPLPDVWLSDQLGEELSLASYRGAPFFVEFIYTTCHDVCVLLGEAFEEINKAAPAGTKLLSISFDPADNQERLGWFAERHKAKAPRWRVASIPDTKARERLLKRAEVIVIPDGTGGFVHNAGLYLVNAQGNLIQVFDPEDTDKALAALQSLAQ